MKVVLDTSVAIKEGYLRSASAHAFFKAAKLLGVSVCLPEVTCDELLGRVDLEIKKQAEAFDKASKKLAELTGKPVPRVDPDEAFSDYEDWLIGILDQYDAEILKYPEISPKELVKASYTGRKPFKKSGEGHKDYLIWRTLLTLAEEEPKQEIVFLTRNTHDFCDEKSEPPGLHPELANHLSEGAARVRVVEELGLLFNEVLAPKLEGANPEDIPDDIFERAQGAVVELLTDYSAYGFEGLPLQNELHISYVDNVLLDPPVLKVLGDDEILARFSGTVDAEFSGFMEKSEYYSYDGALDINVWDSDWNDWVMMVTTSDQLSFEVELIVAKASKELTGIEIKIPREVSFNEY